MDDRSRVAIGVLVGAVVGGLASFLFFTQRGERFRAEIGPKLNALLDEAGRLEGAAARIREAASGGWRSLSDMLGESAARPDPGAGPLH